MDLIQLEKVNLFDSIFDLKDFLGKGQNADQLSLN